MKNVDFRAKLLLMDSLVHLYLDDLILFSLFYFQVLDHSVVEVYLDQIILVQAQK